MPKMQVSNWGTKHIQELLDAGSPLPVLNQIDLHPFMRRPEIVDICEKNNILLEVSPAGETPSSLRPTSYAAMHPTSSDLDM